MTPKSGTLLADITPYQFFMLALCILALMLLGAEVLVPLNPETRTILDYADNFLCLLFLADFVRNLTLAPNKMRYMVTWGWIDLLSSIPAYDALRVGRAARVFRLLRVLRLLKSARAVMQLVAAKRGESAGMVMAISILFLIVAGSIGVLRVEMPAGGNIQSAEDAIWWAITTMTTVGYGDRFPITSEGRLIAALLMAAGVGVVGTLSALMASWFLAPSTQQADYDREEIKQMIRELQQQLAAVRAQQSNTETGTA